MIVKETCSCGGEIEIECTLVATALRMLTNWRKRHNCQIIRSINEETPLVITQIITKEKEGIRLEDSNLIT